MNEQSLTAKSFMCDICKYGEVKHTENGTCIKCYLNDKNKARKCFNGKKFYFARKEGEM